MGLKTRAPKTFNWSYENPGYLHALTLYFAKVCTYIAIG